MHQFLTKNWVKLKMIRIFWRREVDHFHAFDKNPLHFELVFGIIITTHNLQFNQRKWPILQTLPFNCCPIKRLCSWQKNDTRWSNFERFSKNCMTPFTQLVEKPLYELEMSDSENTFWTIRLRLILFAGIINTAFMIEFFM